MEDSDNIMHRKMERLAESAASTFWGYLGCEFVHIQNGVVTIALEAKPHHLNPIGMVHGGVLSSLLDTAMGIVTMTARPEEKVVTTNLNVHFVSPLYAGRLLVTAELVHQSRKMLTAQGRVTDNEGILGTMGTGTFRVI